MDPIYGTKAYWDGVPSVIHIKPEEIPNGVRIDRFGFHSIGPFYP